MTADEHSKIINDLMKAEIAGDQAQRSLLLTQLSEDYTKTLAQIETLNSEKSDLAATNDTLQAANMKLFLERTSVPKTEPEDKPEDTPNDKKLDFADLFDKTGKLKR